MVETRNTVSIYNNFLIDYFNELKESGRTEEIQSRGVSKIKVFGDDGEIYTGKFKHEGATAELVFDQIDLQLETIMGGEE